jgi:hypothetical protein
MTMGGSRGCRGACAPPLPAERALFPDVQFSNFKYRCSEMRFQANPDGTILPQNYIELLCEARGKLDSLLNYFEIRD